MLILFPGNAGAKLATLPALRKLSKRAQFRLNPCVQLGFRGLIQEPPASGEPRTIILWSVPMPPGFSCNYCFSMLFGGILERLGKSSEGCSFFVMELLSYPIIRISVVIILWNVAQTILVMGEGNNYLFGLC